MNFKHISFCDADKKKTIDKVIEIINPKGKIHILNCQGANMAVELLNRKFPVENIYLVDETIWGNLWKANSNKEFNLDYFYNICKDIPDKNNDAKNYLEFLSLQDSNFDTLYYFVLLESTNKNKSGVTIKNNRWHNYKFKSFPKTKKISSSVFDDVSRLFITLRQAKVYHKNFLSYDPCFGSIYVNNPMSHYGANNVLYYCNSLSVPCYLHSEKLLTQNGFLVSVDACRKENCEKLHFFDVQWLSYFKPNVKYSSTEPWQQVAQDYIF